MFLARCSTGLLLGTLFPCRLGWLAVPALVCRLQNSLWITRSEPLLIYGLLFVQDECLRDCSSTSLMCVYPVLKQEPTVQSPSSPSVFMLSPRLGFLQSTFMCEKFWLIFPNESKTLFFFSTFNSLSSHNPYRHFCLLRLGEGNGCEMKTYLCICLPKAGT